MEKATTTANPTSRPDHSWTRPVAITPLPSAHLARVVTGACRSAQRRSALLAAQRNGARRSLRHPIQSKETCIVLVVQDQTGGLRMDAIEALLARPSLPPPKVRAALRQAEGLTQVEVAEAIGVTRVAFHRWETGQAEPRARSRAAYLRLLQGIANKHPEIDLEGSST
ncbi:helix-turn-helix domain-containing protein [Streptomyces clavifer]|uniref:helix-turn-helix domain-containing protein n=1 Tax=Streptomyces clavifer TaxID=68188 RepID=UPI0033E4F8EB